MGKLKKVDGPQKAAIFLMAMGDEFTRAIFKGLTDHEMKLLGKRMAALEDVTIPVGHGPEYHGRVLAVQLRGERRHRQRHRLPA